MGGVYVNELTFTNLSVLLETKPMKPGKKKWYFRCERCKLVYNSIEHGEYTLINTFALDYFCNIDYGEIHEGTMFCSPTCAVNHLKSLHIDIDSAIKTITAEDNKMKSKY